MDIAWSLRDARARLVRRIRWALSPGHRRVPHRWLRRPALADGDALCLFVALARDGGLLPHSLFHARAWAEAGFRVVLVVVVDDPAAGIDPAGLDFAAGVMLRGNRGYDFGAWAAAIAGVPELARLSLLAIANDSVFGPFGDFAAIIARARAAPADVVGLTESTEPVLHLQSYVLFFKPRALASRAFARFWRGVRTGTRDLVVNLCELRLAGAMARGGLRWAALFPYDPADAPNPTLIGWRALVRDGFPYLKAQLVRDNPFGVSIEGWQQVLAAHGYDPALAEVCLAPPR